MIKKIYFFIGFTIAISNLVAAQKITYNVKINKSRDVKLNGPGNVIITNKIDSQIIYNTQNGYTNKIYVLAIDHLAHFTGREQGDKKPNITRMIFGNPDSLNMRDINFSIKFSEPVDTAFFVDILPKSKGFNSFDPKSPIRDSFEKIDPAKKFIKFKAGYLKAGYKITLFIFDYTDTTKINSIGIEGAGRLW